MSQTLRYFNSRRVSIGQDRGVLHGVNTGKAKWKNVFQDRCTETPGHINKQQDKPPDKF